MAVGGEAQKSQRGLPRMHRYGIWLRNGAVVRVEPESGGRRHFLYPATASKLAKVYAVAHGKKVIYVGYTTQPMATRIRQGLSATGQHGYHGDAWKNAARVGLAVWFFQNEPRESVEAIEAELVYLIRSRTGQWPEAQTEIHFHRVSESDKHRAELILESVSVSFRSEESGVPLND